MNASAAGICAEVVVPGVEGSFSYRVPASLAVTAVPGARVLVPFGRRRLSGVLVETTVGENARATREIEHVLDQIPAFTPALLKFTRWVADYYLCPWGDVLKAALPAGISLDEKRHWVLAGENGREGQAMFSLRHPQAAAIFEALRSGPVSPARMEKQFGCGPRAALLKELQAEGIAVLRPVLKPPRVKSQFDSLITLSAALRAEYGPELWQRITTKHEQHLLREIFEHGPDGVMRSELLRGATSARRQAFARLVANQSVELRQEEVTRWDPENETTPDVVVPKKLTAEQDTAVAALTAAIDRAAFQPFLLFGVTGSGKTQVYIEAIRHALGQGKTALVLLPEIALTPFVWGRFYQAFGDRVAIQHSAQSPAVRFDLWREIRAGKYPVVVGARSAVFAPLSNLGLVVVDEEQESSYKQEEPAPRYHARDAALVRARMENAVVVLGSATPCVETMYHAAAGKYQMLRLPERVGGAVMPEVRIVSRMKRDLTDEEWKADAKELSKAERAVRRSQLQEPPILTDELMACITQTLAAGRQGVLLQNRRGFAPFLICAECGRIPACEECSVSLTYHRRGVALRCHYCDHREPMPDVCPRCNGTTWIAEGLGTQRLEVELAAKFEHARILRMDSDTASRRGMHGRMVSAFAAGEYDLLVGTQMVAKGLDFPKVGLSAVIQADAELFYPDFRSSERGASLILQVAGRAGRRTEAGVVVIQTAAPDHPLLDVVRSGDWEAFAQRELENRRSGSYPPFTRLVLLRAIAKEESSCAKALLKLKRLIQHAGPVEILGPAAAVVVRVRSLYRYQLLVRSTREVDGSGVALRNAVKQGLADYKAAKGEPGVEIEVDVDPQSVT